MINCVEYFAKIENGDKEVKGRDEKGRDHRTNNECHQILSIVTFLYDSVNAHTYARTHTRARTHTLTRTHAHAHIARVHHLSDIRRVCH